MGELSDERLFERLIAGDQDCLRELMERHGDALMLFANGYVHDIHTAEDLMLEAFSRMLARRPHLREHGFKPYLYKTARNLALRHIRMRNRFMSVEDLDDEPAAEVGVEDAVLRDERVRELYRCLEQIPADYREALYLVYIEDMSYDEAAAVMRKTRKQIDNLVARGKRAMRQLMGEEGSL